MNPALLQKGSNSFRTDSEIKDHEGEYDIWSKKIVRYDMRSKLSSHCFSTKHRTRQNVASTKCHCLLKIKENHKKSLCLPDVQLIKARSINFIKLLQS